MNEEPRYLVIPAAGLGTRMRAVNPDIPKEMLPVADKPAIQYAVEEGLSAGIKNIIIIINRNKEMLRQYFEERTVREKLYPRALEKMEEIQTQCKFTFLYQKELLGEADAISLSRDVVGGSPMAIIYPDNIYFPARGALNILKDVFVRLGNDVTALMNVTEENAIGISNSGRVDISPLERDIYQIKRFYAKGQGHFVPRFKGELRTCGITISGSHIFDYIEMARGFVKEEEFTDVPLRKMMLKKRQHLGCRLPGKVFDIGNPKGYEFCLKSVGENDVNSGGFE
jgi:UTP--glucose-1-phosphate uridylyltransferase